MKPRKRIRKRSAKKVLRDKIGAYHLAYLKRQRGNYDKCEICGKKTDRLGRFHILRVGQYPRLEFVEENILLTGWDCCHYPWHHYGPNDDRCKAIHDRIKELRGNDYKDYLLARNAVAPKHTMFYLRNLLTWFEQEEKERHE